MVKNIKKLLNLLVILAMILLLAPSVSAAQKDLMEMDETSESGYSVLGNASVNAKSALRVGDTGTGSNDFTTINAPYNEPRSSSSNASGVRAHKGTDFRSKDSNGNGRKLFFVYNNGEVYQIQNSLNSSGYGRYLLAQHKHVQNSTNYYFQSFYAHLKSVNSSLTVGGAVSNTSQVGISGGSGSSETSYPIHLHLEFRGASATKSNSMRRYPTSFFYSGQGEYGLNTAFINRTAASGTSVTFRIVSMYSGSERYVPQDKVTLYYKNGNMTSWSTTSMTRSSDQKYFTKDLTSLYGTSNTLKYYVKAYTDSYNGSTYYYTFRPYRYSDGTAPTDRPFEVTKTLATTTASISEIEKSDGEKASMIDKSINLPDTVNTKKYDHLQMVTLLNPIEKNKWEVISESGDIYTIKINHINAAPQLTQGEKVLIAGNKSSDNKEKQVIVVDGDNIRIFDEFEE